MNQQDFQPPYSNFPQDQNEDNFSCLLSNSQISSVHPLKTQSDFSSYLPSNNRYEKLHEENIRLSKEIQELINLVEKLEKQKNIAQRKYQQLEKKIRMERMSHNEQMQKIKRQVKDKQNLIQRLQRRSDKENVRINEAVDVDTHQCESIMNGLSHLEKRIEEIYQRMKFGITKQWEIEQFHKYREMLRKEEIKRLETNQTASISKTMTTVKRINERIKKVDQSIDASVNKTKEDLQPMKLRFSDLKKKKGKLCEIPFIQGVDIRREQEYHEEVVRRINQKIVSLTENIKQRRA